MRHLSSTPTREELLNTKIRILSPEHSKAFQEACFNVGFEWCDGETSVARTKEPFLFNGLITGLSSIGTEDYNYFNASIYEEVTFPLPSTLTPHIHRDLIIAWANGANIEYKCSSGKWREATTPCWGIYEFRIKPTTPSPLQLLEDEMRSLAAQQNELADKISKLKENK